MFYAKSEPTVVEVTVYKEKRIRHDTLFGLIRWYQTIESTNIGRRITIIDQEPDNIDAIYLNRECIYTNN